MEGSVSEPTPAATAETNRSSFFSKLARRHASQSPAGDGTMEASSTAPNLIADWEGKVDETLGSTNSDRDKARQMLEMFPQLPADGQEEVAKHLSNLVPDQDYGLMRAYLTNAALPAAVLEVLFGDVLNRPNSLKLPALLDVARTPQHPAGRGGQGLAATLPGGGLRQRLGQMANEGGRMAEGKPGLSAHSMLVPWLDHIAFSPNNETPN